jgi:maltooligosyltrehalose trehalohydrolase
MTSNISTARTEAIPLGASRLSVKNLSANEWAFVLWAPKLERVSVHLLEQANSGSDRFFAMLKDDRGYHFAVADQISADACYFYRLDDGRELPDPASRFQPEGVHGPSQIVDTKQFLWSDQKWTGIALGRTIFYELHVGTYTPEGTFDAVIAQLPRLAKLGITTIELMPVAQFPGPRNWGYDGVFPYAPQNSYGGPQGLQRLVNAAHEQGLGVALDVVYNHLGPEGNYLGEYGPYFTGKYQTPWGQALNYDGAASDEVRRFFLDNALYWLEEYHFDALRLDAVHGIFDSSALHFLAELKLAVEKLSSRLGRQIHVVAESDLNDSRMILPKESGGHALDGQWSDDFHHSLHTLLTKEKAGYYEDFGTLSHLADTVRNGWSYSGQYSRHRHRKHGNSAYGITPQHFVVCSQNHDQIGNRAQGDRLSALVDFESLKLAAGVTLLSPFVPLLFMGEEYGETAPFQYFIHHQDPNLVEAVRRGRREEFAAFGWQVEVPDPQDEATFLRSQLRHPLREQEPHATLFAFYRELIKFRKQEGLGDGGQWKVWECSTSMLLVLREGRSNRLAMIFNFSENTASIVLPHELKGLWRTRLHSADASWKGQAQNFPVAVNLSKPFSQELHPHSFVVLEQSSSDRELE